MTQSLSHYTPASFGLATTSQDDQHRVGGLFVPQWVTFAVVTALSLFFIDETIRKALPGRPVYVTAIKDLLFFFIGLWAIQQPLKYKGLLVLFVPWLLVVAISGLMVTAEFFKPSVPLAIGRTYAIAPALFLTGLLVGQSPPLARLLFRVGVVGVSITLFLTFMQENARGLLPGFLQVNIYKEAHVMAGGRFNEGSFNSAQVLSLVLMAVATFTFAMLFDQANLRRRVPLTILLVLCLYGIYVARVRIGVLITILSVAAVSLGLLRSNISSTAVAGRAVFGGVLLIVVAAVASVLIPNQDASTAETDASFYERALTFEVISDRLFFFQSEVAGSSVPPMFGQGIGTAGAVRNVINSQDLSRFESVADTGTALIFRETGYVGLACFVLVFAGLPFLAWVRLSTLGNVPLAGVAAMAVALGAAGWFFFKSHTVLGNGASQTVWMVSTGLFFGFLARRNVAETPQDGDLPVVFEHEGVLPAPAQSTRQLALRPEATRDVLGPPVSAAGF